MRKGICCAGNMIVDICYPVTSWPKQGELTHITGGISMSTGGSVCNTVCDLAALDPSLPLYAAGVAGHDAEGDLILAELGRYGNIDLSGVRRGGRTAFTVVMNDLQTGERTFFYHSGAAERFGEAEIELDAINASILHVGYALLLPELDSEDAEYGTKLARLFHNARAKGMKTSLDVVSEAGERFAKVVSPALRFCDYCVINELEAQRISGVPLRDENGLLLRENLPAALSRLRELGVKEWAVIHCPELGCGMDSGGAYFECASLLLPDGWIKGTVGAGDAFCAGVLYAAHEGLGIEVALRLGSCAAAASLSSGSASGAVGPAGEMLALEKTFPRRKF